jgi:proton-translocating NADH-quinone oxidoreductase chain M
MTYLTSSLGESSLLGTIAAIPLYAAIFILFIDSKNLEYMKKVALGASMFTFVLSLGLWVLFDRSTAVFQFREYWQWLDQVNINFNLGIDGISLFFVILTTLLVPLCLLASWNSIKIHVKEYLIAFLVMETLLIIFFSIMDLLLFYVFFESVLIPMFLIVGIWGSRERKIRAAYLLFLYTLVGSVLMLLAILLIYFIAGTITYTNLLTIQFDESLQKFLWLALFASFAVNVPMVPVHIWLPEAHVEAPTAGSVILAGVLLKLGSYGLIRFSMPLFPAATIYFTPLVYTMAAIAVIYTSLTAIRQSDMKRIIAYASVAHMNVILVGMFALNMQGLEGAMIQMLSHGLVSSALFLCVGVLYDRHHSRMVKYYSGVAHTMPIFAILFMFMTMANIALPCTSSFVGEFLILAGTFQVNTTICVLAGTGMILGGGYSLWLYNRIAFGNLKIQAIKQFSDMNRREFMVFLPLTIGTLVMGIYPEIFLDPMHVSIAGLIEHINCQVR